MDFLDTRRLELAGYTYTELDVVVVAVAVAVDELIAFACGVAVDDPCCSCAVSKNDNYLLALLVWMESN